MSLWLDRCYLNGGQGAGLLSSSVMGPADSGGGWCSCGTQGANHERDPIVWEITVVPATDCSRKKRF